MSELKKHRVVITGIGLVTPVGNNAVQSWQSIINGKSGIVNLNHLDLEGFPCKVGGKVSGEEEELNKVFPPVKQRKASRFINLAVLAGYEAMRDAGFDNSFPKGRNRFGTCVGVGMGGLQTIREGALTLAEFGQKRISPFLLPILYDISIFLSISPVF